MRISLAAELHGSYYMGRRSTRLAHNLQNTFHSEIVTMKACLNLALVQGAATDAVIAQP